MNSTVVQQVMERVSPTRYGNTQEGTGPVKPWAAQSCQQVLPLSPKGSSRKEFIECRSRTKERIFYWKEECVGRLGTGQLLQV